MILMVTKLKFQKEIYSLAKEKCIEKYPDTVYINSMYLDEMADIIVGCLWNNIEGAEANEVEVFIEAAIVMMLEMVLKVLFVNG
ncbi:MAG: hypothetical protein HC930_10145 [Hydrococcus sp. SU_1_0]|nr:hypothetical protein [Hydrococcus sp. SU_1_0]